MENSGGFMQSVKATAHNVMGTRKIRRYFLVFIILTIGGVLMFTLNHSSSFRFGSYTSSGEYFGLDSDEKPITAQNNRWGGQTVARDIELPEATWTCTDDHLSEKEKDTKANRRTRQCVVQNLCVDRQGTDQELDSSIEHDPQPPSTPYFFEKNFMAHLLLSFFCVPFSLCS
jgi:hypothetical protein